MDPSTTHKNKKNLCVAYWNVDRGYLTRGKKDELQSYISAQGIDICAVAEVQITNTSFYNDYLYEIEGFYQIKPISWTDYNQARILLYCRKSLENIIKLRLDLMSRDQPDIFIEISPVTGKSFIVAFYYREWTGLFTSNSAEDQLLRLKCFLNNVKKSRQNQTKEIWIIGDMNLNWKHYFSGEIQNRELIEEVKDLMIEEGLTQIVENITRTRVVENRIQEGILDHIYTSDLTKLESLSITEVSCSDHSLITFRRKMAKNSIKKQVKVRSFKNFVEKDFLQDLNKHDWTKVTEEIDVDNSTKLFTSYILETLETHAPEKKITINDKHIDNLSELTKTKLRERENAYKQYKETRNNEDKEKWKKLKNKVTNLIDIEKKQRMNEKFKNQKSTWELLKTMEKKMNTGGPPTKLSDGGKMISGCKAMSTLMNNFFVNKIKNNRNIIEQQIPPYKPEDHLRQALDQNITRWSLKKVKDTQVMKIIEEIKNSTGSGMDGIPNKILKIARNVICKPLTYIINKSIETGKVPYMWKEAKIIPLHKKGSTSSAKNYRPIAILSKLSLVLETVVMNQITEHFTRNELFSEDQNGYIKGRSTTTALISMYDQWTRAANEKKYTGILLMDMTAAFDLVDKDILTKKLEVMGAGQETINWITDYLSHRKQCVNVGSSFSEYKYLEWGVPQGSKLGPLLFNIFTTDMSKCTKNGKMVLYADDSSLCYHDLNPYTISEKLNEDAVRITRWMLANKLLLAPDKTEFMLAAAKAKARPAYLEQIKLKVGGFDIKQSNNIKMLGVIFNRDLNFNSYLHGTEEEKGLLQNLSNRLWLLKRIKGCPEDKMRTLMNGIFVGKMMYACQLYGGLNEGQCHQLQLLQNRAAKIVTNQGGNTSSSDALKRCKWLNFKRSVKLHSVLLFYKNRVTKSSKYILHRTMGARSQLFSQMPEHETIQIGILKNSFIPRSIREWNSLPLIIRKSISTTKLKSNLRTHYMEEA